MKIKFPLMSTACFWIVVIFTLLTWTTAYSGSDSADQKNYQRLVKEISKELLLKFRSSDHRGLQERRKRLRTLFKKIPRQYARKFHDHLGTKARRNSNYSKTFHYRLATPTRRELLTILKERFPKNTKTKKVMSRAMSPYMTKCADADVPLPPDWRNNRRKNKELGWRFQGILDRKMVLASRLPLTEVWAYKDPKGLCMALPRKNRKGEIQLLGMICQSKRKGNACFWDNKRRGTKPAQLIVGADTNYMKVSEMQGGTELDENCTQCHRGRNVFIVHLGSPLKVAKVYPDKKTRYKPIPTGRISGLKGKPKTPWENPASFIPFNSNSDGCGQCHEIPALTIKYCDVVLKGVFKKNLMPPRGWGSWRDAEYIADFNKIADKCKKGFRGVSVDLRKALKLP